MKCSLFLHIFFTYLSPYTEEFSVTSEASVGKPPNVGGHSPETFNLYSGLG